MGEDNHPYFDSETDKFVNVTTNFDENEVSVGDKTYTVEEWKEVSGVCNRYYRISSKPVEQPEKYITDTLKKGTGHNGVELCREIDVRWLMENTEIEVTRKN